MARQYVEQLAAGESVDEVYLVTGCQLRANRQGNLYLHVELRDRTGVLSARLWNASEDLGDRFGPGTYVHVRGKIQLFHGTVQLILSQINEAPGHEIDPGEYLPPSPVEIAQLSERLRTLLLSLSDPYLRTLAECYLSDEEFLDRFVSAPAGVREHHAYHGGLLHHVVTMLEIADRIAPLYPNLNRDLLLIGVLLHDVGKIDELSYQFTFGYTDVGQLVGHLVQGVELLQDKIRQAESLLDEPFPDELLVRIKHMIVSHHGSLEYGSPKVPMTPEAVALHFVDSLDSKLTTVLEEIRNDPTQDSTWTAFHANLGRRIFKGSSKHPSTNGAPS